MKKIYVLPICMLGILYLHAQELFVYTEPASNMPARSLSLKVTANYNLDKQPMGRITQRYVPELMWGVSKKVMVHAAAGFSDMHRSSFRYEGGYLYAKYRFFSADDVHSHFRMAAFAKAAYTNNPFNYDEVSLLDKSGVMAGVIATGLANRIATSVTISHTQLLDKSRNDKLVYVPERNYQAMNYSLSAGYLLLPRNYTDFKQTNLNLYAELLAQQTLDRKMHYIDFAPSVQFIFNSISKLNIGYRFQLSGNMTRMGKKSFLVSYEYAFLNVFRKK